MAECDVTGAVLLLVPMLGAEMCARHGFNNRLPGFIGTHVAKVSGVVDPGQAAGHAAKALTVAIAAKRSQRGERGQRSASNTAAGREAP